MFLGQGSWDGARKWYQSSEQLGTRIMEALCCFQFFFLCIGQPFLVLEGTLCSLQGFLKLSLPCFGPGKGPRRG